MAGLQPAMGPNVEMLTSQVVLWFQQYENMQSEQKRVGEARERAFESKREVLRKDLMIIQQKIAQLEREHDDETKEWQESCRVKLNQHEYTKVLSVYMECATSEYQTQDDAPPREQAQAPTDLSPHISGILTPERDPEQMPDVDSDPLLPERSAEDTTRVLSSRKSRRLGLRSRPVGNTEQLTTHSPELHHGPRKRKPAARAAQDAEALEMSDNSALETSDKPKSKKRKMERTIEFQHLYEDGAIEPRHTIVEFPKDTNDWYILRCTTHLINFGINPIAGAMKHISGRQHGELKKEAATAIRELGVRVLGCNRKLARDNNLAFRRAWKQKRQLRSGDLLSSARGLLRSQDIPTESVDIIGKRGSSTCGAESQRNPKNKFDGVTNPVVGELYQGYWRHSDSWYMVVPLPLADFTEIGISGKLGDTGLIRHVPVCYLSAGKKITGWDDDYKDGGPRMTKRKFPCMFLEDALEVPLQGKFELPKRDVLFWLPAKFLRPAGYQHIGGRKVEGQAAAQKFQARLQAIRQRQEECRNTENNGNGQSMPPDSRQSSAPVASNSANDSGTSEQKSVADEGEHSRRQVVSDNSYDGVKDTITVASITHELHGQRSQPIEISDSSEQGDHERRQSDYEDAVLINDDSSGDNLEGIFTGKHFADLLHERTEDNVRANLQDGFVGQFEDVNEDDLEGNFEDLEYDFEDDSDEEFQEGSDDDREGNLENNFEDNSDVRNQLPETGPIGISQDARESTSPTVIPPSCEETCILTQPVTSQIFGKIPEQPHHSRDLGPHGAGLAETALSALQLQTRAPSIHSSTDSSAPTGTVLEKVVDHQVASHHPQVTLPWILHDTPVPKRPQDHNLSPGGMRGDSFEERAEGQMISPTHTPTLTRFSGNYPQLERLSFSPTVAGHSPHGFDPKHLGARVSDETYLSNPLGGNAHLEIQSDQYSGDQGRNRVRSRGTGQRQFCNRTKTGCLTCRKRKKKCDELKPACGNCLRSGHECLGYRYGRAEGVELELDLRSFGSFDSV